MSKEPRVQVGTLTHLRLTPLEQKVAQYLEAGMTSAEIGELLAADGRKSYRANVTRIIAITIEKLTIQRLDEQEQHHGGYTSLNKARGRSNPHQPIRGETTRKNGTD